MQNTPFILKLLTEPELRDPESLMTLVAETSLENTPWL